MHCFSNEISQNTFSYSTSPVAASRKHQFHYILRRAVPKNGHIYCLDKCLPCYVVVSMFLSPGVFSYFKLKIG